ncbi:MAG: putative rane protein [Firmicutes bacterium]|nr:putative rane protein [Bacillota bacterium]
MNVDVKILIRFFIFILGLFFMGLGISLTTKSTLGTSPISSIPYELSMIFPVTMGQFTFLLSLLCVIAEILILRRDFPKGQLFQLLVGPFFGAFIDVGMFIFGSVNPSLYVEKVIVLLIGCIFLALGIYLQIVANVIINPGEGLVKTIANKLEKEFGGIKVMFDSTLVVVALIISLLAFGKLEGLREGTIISALVVGYITKIISKLFSCINFEKLLY